MTAPHTPPNAPRHDLPRSPAHQRAEIKRRLRQRNIALALLLMGFVVLFYAITFVKIGSQ